LQEKGKEKKRGHGNLVCAGGGEGTCAGKEREQVGLEGGDILGVGEKDRAGLQKKSEKVGGCSRKQKGGRMSSRRSLRETRLEKRGFSKPGKGRKQEPEEEKGSYGESQKKKRKLRASKGEKEKKVPKEKGELLLCTKGGIPLTCSRRGFP